MNIKDYKQFRKPGQMKKNLNTVCSTNCPMGRFSYLVAIATSIGIVASGWNSQVKASPSFIADSTSNALVAKVSKKTDKSTSKTVPAKDEKTESKAEAKPIPQPPIENVVDVTTNQLVDKPQDFLNKNVKFTAKFFAYNSLALDYKPAMRSSRTNLSFLVLRPEAHVPFAEIKLAMALPKEKDPETLVLASLKEGDQVEVIGKVFAMPLDEPWIDVLRLKKLTSANDDKKDDKKLSANESEATKKEHASSLDNTVKGKMLQDKDGAFPPDAGAGKLIKQKKEETKNDDIIEKSAPE
jgi:hypothetical protein